MHIAKGISVSALLTSINLSNNMLGAMGAEHIAQSISASASLTSIDLGRNSVGKKMALQLVEIFREKQMVSVGLAGCNLRVDGAQAVAEYISVSASLTNINLNSNDIGSVGAEHIAKAIAVSASLTSIDLNDNEIGAVGAEHIAQAISFSASLTSVNLLRNVFNDEIVSMLLRLKEEQPSLLTLCGLELNATEADFSSRNLNSNDAKLLAPEIAASASLTGINLSGNKLTNYGRDMSGIQAIASAIGVSASLTSVDIGYNRIGHEMALKLVGVFKEKQMVSVGLANCSLGNDGAQAVADYISVSASLTRIDLRKNILGDEGAKHIAKGIAVSASLTQVLAFCSLTPALSHPLTARVLCADQPFRQRYWRLLRRGRGVYHLHSGRTNGNS